MSKFHDYRISDLSESLLKDNRILQNTLSIVNKQSDENVSETNILFSDIKSNLYEDIKSHLEEFNINPSKIYKITIDEQIFPNLILQGFNNPETKGWEKYRQFETDKSLFREFSSWRDFIQHPEIMEFLRFCKKTFSCVTVQSQRNNKEKLVEVITLRANTEIDARLSENIKYALVQVDKRNNNANPILKILTLCNGRHSYRVMSNLLELSNEKYRYGTRKCTTHSWVYPKDGVKVYENMMKKTANIKLLLAITISSNIVPVLCGLQLNDVMTYADNVPDFKQDTYEDVRPSAKISAKNIINRPAKISDAIIPSRAQNRKSTDKNQIETNRKSTEKVPRNQQDIIVDKVLTNIIVDKVITNTSRSKDGGNCSKSNDVINLDCNKQNEVISIKTLADNIVTGYTQSNNLVQKVNNLQIIEEEIKRQVPTLYSPDSNTQNMSTHNKSPKYEIKDDEDNTKSSKLTELEKKKREIDEEIEKAEREEKEAKELKRREREDKIQQQKIEEENKKKFEKEILIKNEEIKRNFPVQATATLTQILNANHVTIDMNNDLKRKMDNFSTQVEELKSSLLELNPNKKLKTERTVEVEAELQLSLKLKKSNDKIKELKEQLDISKNNASESENSTQKTIQMLQDKNREYEALISKDTEQINTTIVNQRNEIEQLKLDMTNTNNKIDLLNTQLVEKENLIKEKENKLLEKESQLVEKEKILTEKDNLLKEQNKLVLEKESENGCHKADLEIQNEMLREFRERENQIKEEKEKDKTNDSIELRSDHFNCEQYCIELNNSFKTNTPETSEDMLQKFDSFIIDQIEVYDISVRDNFNEATKNVLIEVVRQLKGEKPGWNKIVQGREELQGRTRKGTSRNTARGK